jgi:predicted enzyme related to lactoylglutathione lyase
MTDLTAINQIRLCIDANDVARITDFWSSLLGYRVRETESTDPADDWRHLEPWDPTLPRLTIQPVPEGKQRKNRLHLDVFVSDPEPWIDRCLELGGSLLWKSEDPDDWFQVIADPEGNEFCICRSSTPEE